MNNSKNIDIIICGGGCSAMLLLFYLQQYPKFEQLKILVIEKDVVNDNKTWCFWHKGNHPLQHLITSSWNNIQFADKNFSTKQSIFPYQYASIKGKDFFQYFHRHFIPQFPNIHIIKDEVLRIEKCTSQSSKVVGFNGIYEATTVYSSIVEKNFYKSPIFLWQHFKGWHIKTEENVFDNATITLMDFSNCSPNSCDFLYVLPFAKNEALIEFTAFSKELWDDKVYIKKFEQFAGHQLKGIHYTIVSVEQGKIPMAHYHHSAVGSGGQILIGTAAGKIKATSGYGFEKMRADAETLATTYFKRATPKQNKSHRFKFYDKLLLKIILQNPQQAVSILGQLFKKIPAAMILKFLYEETSLYEEALIFSKLPVLPFIKRI
jgi:lycopene beta-cyclase